MFDGIDRVLIISVTAAVLALAFVIFYVNSRPISYTVSDTYVVEEIEDINIAISRLEKEIEKCQKK